MAGSGRKGDGRDAPPRSTPQRAPGKLKKLGELLRASKRVTPQQLEHALENQQRSQGKLGEHLVRAGVLDEEMLAMALAAQHGLPHLSDAQLRAWEIPPPLLTRVPREQAKKLGVLPLTVREGVLFVATADPATPEREDAVRFSLGASAVTFVVVSPGALRAAIAWAYGATRR